MPDHHRRRRQCWRCWATLQAEFGLDDVKPLLAGGVEPRHARREVAAVQVYVVAVSIPPATLRTNKAVFNSVHMHFVSALSHIRAYKIVWACQLIIGKRFLKPQWLLQGLPMLMDPHPSQQHAGLHPGVWQLQQKVTRPKIKDKRFHHCFLEYR